LILLCAGLVEPMGAETWTFEIIRKQQVIGLHIKFLTVCVNFKLAEIHGAGNRKLNDDISVRRKIFCTCQRHCCSCSHPARVPTTDGVIP